MKLREGKQDLVRGFAILKNRGFYSDKIKSLPIAYKAYKRNLNLNQPVPSRMKIFFGQASLSLQSNTFTQGY